MDYNGLYLANFNRVVLADLADLNRLLRDCSRSHAGSCKTHLAMLPSWHQAFQAPAENASQQQMSANPLHIPCAVAA